MVPIIDEARRSQPDLAKYRAAAGPKAIAIYAWGRVFVTTGGVDQVAAEARALNDCNDDPNRKGDDPSCYLYAIGNDAVLPMRMPEPTGAEAAYARITAARARVAPRIASDRIAIYTNDTEPKAIAVHVESARTFASWGLYSENRAAAETLALEGCQQTYGSACVLVAVGTGLRASDPVTSPKRDMPRLHATGMYSADMVPFVAVGHAPDLRSYAKLPSPKAIAIRAVNMHFSIISGAANSADAERRALAACNDPNTDLRLVPASGALATVRTSDRIASRW